MTNMKPDKLAILRHMLAGGIPVEVEGIHPKRLYSMMRKWADRGLVDWGVSHRVGWLTEKGKEWARTQVREDTDVADA